MRPITVFAFFYCLKWKSSITKCKFNLPLVLLLVFFLFSFFFFLYSPLLDLWSMHHYSSIFIMPMCLAAFSMLLFENTSRNVHKHGYMNWVKGTTFSLIEWQSLWVKNYCPLGLMVKERMSDTRMTCEYIRVTYGCHTSTYE